MGPNRRAQERERAAARTAAEAKRAAAERKAVTDAQKIVAIWNARAKPAVASCGSTRRSAPPSLRVCLGSPTHAQRASKSALSTCAPSTGIRALRFPPSSRRCRRCSPNSPFARLEMLAAERPRRVSTSDRIP